MYEIEFKPLGLSAHIRKDQTIIEAAKIAGLDMVSVCGGHGTCRQCRIRVLSGHISTATSDEKDAFSLLQLKNGYRLACQTRPLGHCVINILPDSLSTDQRMQLDGPETHVAVDPPVREYSVKLSADFHSFADIKPEQLTKALSEQQRIKCRTIDSEVLQRLKSEQTSNGAIQASVRGAEIIALRLWPGRNLGLAVDLGTTKIAGYLLEMESGRTIAAQGTPNPQAGYGDDIIARLTHARDSASGATKMQRLAVDAMHRLASNLCIEAGAKTDDIIETVVVGNTAMHHLLLKLPVAQLLQPPFIPYKKNATDVKARDLGLRFALGSYVHFLPNVAGFVGSDHIAMLLASGVVHTDKTALAIDIGTNTEISLISKGEIACVSCASGPAFEGGHIKHGMKAAAGAIDRLQIIDGKMQYHTIGGMPPKGLCGSAIIDAVSQLHQVGVLDDGGRMQDHQMVRTRNGRREFVVVSGEANKRHTTITITQRDVRELQLAKAALRTGIEVLLNSKGVSGANVDQVVVAGAFGSYLDITSAITIGMFPSLPLERFSQVGNAAGAGARMALISRSTRRAAQHLARRIKYIELSNTPGFDQIFTGATRIEPMTWRK